MTSEQALATIQSEIATRTASGKLYIYLEDKTEHNSDFVSPFCKKLLIQNKANAELLICISAETLIQSSSMGQNNQPFPEYLEMFLKKAENILGVKPHIVLTQVKMEEFYDLVFTFEARWQRKGYKVREQYYQKGFPENKKHILSEYGFGNNDHIPLFKKTIFVMELGENALGFQTIMSQMYCDQEINMDSTCAVLPEVKLDQEKDQNLNSSLSLVDDFDTLKSLIIPILNDNHPLKSATTPIDLLLLQESQNSL